jgi:hypothetical protein
MSGLTVLSSAGTHIDKRMMRTGICRDNAYCGLEIKTKDTELLANVLSLLSSVVLERAGSWK